MNICTLKVYIDSTVPSSGQINSRVVRAKKMDKEAFHDEHFSRVSQEVCHLICEIRV